MNRCTLAAATLIYAATVVLANVLTDQLGLVSVGFGLLVTAGTYAAGLALLARDFVHRHATAVLGPRAGVSYALAAVLAAGVASWFLASPGLAVASTVAFLAAELVDLAVFLPTRERWGFLTGALTSNVVSAPIDTVLFLWIAGFPITADAVGGQFIGKVLWATIVPLAVWALLTTRTRRELAAA